MVLFVVGLGLGSEKDITVRGLEAVKSCDYVFLEAYTSILGVKKDKLEEFYGKKVIEADRDTVEQQADTILVNLPREISTGSHWNYLLRSKGGINIRYLI